MTSCPISLDLDAEALQEIFADLRASAPLWFDPARNGFFVSRYRDVEAILKEAGLFSSEYGVSIDAVDGPKFDLGTPSIISAPPAVHKRLRSFVNPAFRAKDVEYLLPLFSRLAGMRFRSRQSRGNIISDYVIPFAFDCFSLLLGVRGARRERLRALMFAYVKQDVADWTVEEKAGNSSGSAFLVQSILELSREHVAELARTRRKSPLGEVLRERPGGDRLDEAEVAGIMFMILVAGFEDSVRSLASMIELVGTHAAQQHRLRNDVQPMLFNAVDEALRFEASTQFLRRVATARCALADRPVEAKTSLFVMLGSANRDEDVFPAGGQFDIARSNARASLSFGAGPHVCPGASAARLLCAAGLRPFVMTDGPFEIDTGRTRRVYSGNVHGIVELFLRND